ncbi:MAG: Rossmann-like and DUF2520 domain-containing protein [Acidimicrobiales bacterium]
MFGRDDDPAEAAHLADVVIITVPDDAISPVASSVRPGPAVVLHTSGAAPLDVLAPHPRRGSVHPLVSLPDPTTGAARLTGGAVFAVAGDPVAARLVEDLGGRAIRVDDEDRALYHATAAIAANHLVALCAQVERLADQVGVPVEVYWDLMSSTLDNVRRVGPAAALTGPAARGDWATVRRHLDALPDPERDLYRGLAAAAARLAGTPVDTGLLHG